MTGGKRGEDKRTALIQATAALIMEKGIAATTTREIAERAGSTERTLFKQFGSKNGLLTAVVDIAAKGQLAQSGFATLASAPPPTLAAFEQWHRELLTERIGSQATGSEVGRLFLLEIIQNEDFKQRYSGIWSDGVWKPLLNCLDRLKLAGEIDRAANTMLLAQSFLSLNLGYLVSRLNVAPRLDWDTTRDAASIAAFFRNAASPA